VGWYSDQATSVVFTDISHGMLHKAKLRWEEEPRPYNATFVLSDVEALTEVCLSSEAP
jgi:ubiquinone/menaquinone biosynthesis C-methylase UbiE